MKLYATALLTTLAMVAVTHAAETTAPAAAPTDPEIAHIVVTANTIDIDAGKLALSKSTNPEVKNFAQQMITDHTDVKKQATDLAGKLKVTPQANATSASLNASAESATKKLQGLKGSAFDKAYADNEVVYHQGVLDAIDKTLIPNAKNAELKGLISTVRPAIAAHLDHAKMMQKSLTK